MSNQIIHIGYPKTATTYLQWKVFPFLKGIHYVDYNSCRDIFPQIVCGDRLDHDLDLLNEKLVLYGSKESSNLYSYESLSGSPFALKGMNRSLIPETLKEAGFNKVLITVRDQAKAIDSYYRQYIVHGGTLRFKKWLDINNHRQWMLKHFSLSYLKYDKLVKFYQSIFGEENVLVINSDEFRFLSEESISKIIDFTGAAGLEKNEKKSNGVNTSLTNLSTELLRICNYFTFNAIRPSQFFHDSISTRNIWLGFKLIFDPYFFRFFSSSKSYVKRYGLEDRLREYYKESNEELSKICSVKF